jgi:FkbM family methyltransferase
MRHAFRDFTRFLRGKPTSRDKTPKKAAQTREHAQAGIATPAMLDERRIKELIGEEIDRLDGYLAYHHERTLNEVLAHIGPRFFYSSPTVDAILSHGAFDIVIPTTETALLADISRHGRGCIAPEIDALIESRVRPGAAIVEVGAGIGLHTLPLAAAVGPGGRVDSFEPRPHLASALGRTLRLNGFSDRVRVHRERVSSRSGEALRAPMPNGSGPMVFAPTVASTPIASRETTLDEKIPCGGQVDLVMIAMGQAEPELLTGMQRIATENRQLEIVCGWSAPGLASNGCDPAALGHQVRSLGFTPYRVEATWDNTPAFTPANDLGSIESALLLLTRQAMAG